MSLLIDQNDTLDYCNFSHENLNVYQLSEFQLVFSGDTRTQDGWKPDWAKYAPYQMNIHNPSSFPVIPENLIEPGRKLNYRNIHIADVFWRHFVPFSDEVAAIGHCNVNLLLCQVKMDAFENIENLQDPRQLGEITLNRIHNDVADRNRFIYPKSYADLKPHWLKDRLWLQSNEGNLDIHRDYGFHTALTHEHILTITFEPRGHWEQGTAPTPSQLEKVFVSFWDFMYHLNITEHPKPQNQLTPGKTLRGEQKRIADENARIDEQRERNKAQLSDNLPQW